MHLLKDVKITLKIKMRIWLDYNIVNKMVVAWFALAFLAMDPVNLRLDERSNRLETDEIEL